MPLNLSFTHIMVVLVVALIVLGPDKLPGTVRTVAGTVRELRRMSADLQTQARDTFGELTEPISELVNTVSGAVAAPALVAESAGTAPVPASSITNV